MSNILTIFKFKFKSIYGKTHLIITYYFYIGVRIYTRTFSIMVKSNMSILYEVTFIIMLSFRSVFIYFLFCPTVYRQYCS